MQAGRRVTPAMGNQVEKSGYALVMESFQSRDKFLRMAESDTFRTQEYELCYLMHGSIPPQTEKSKPFQGTLVEVEISYLVLSH